MAPVGPRFLAVGLAGAAAVLALLAFVGDDAAAQGSAANTTDFTFTVTPVAGKTEWFVKELSVPAGSKMQLVYNSTKAGLPHDIQVCTAGTAPGTCANAVAPIRVAGTTKNIAPDSPAVETEVFTLPAAGLTYVCSLHPEMVGKITVGVFSGTGGAAGEADITHAGVHYLAYWVGVISFALLFVVYGATFFLFKHGETPETTDQKDRPGFEDKRTIAGMSEYVWVVVGLVVVALGVVIFFQIMLSGF